MKKQCQLKTNSLHKTISLVTLVILLLIPGSWTKLAAQTSCLPTGKTFRYQYEIDDFKTTYGGCTIVEGSVIIDGATNTSITNLFGLDDITQIGGQLSIYGNYELPSLSGLDQVENIGYHLFVTSNPLLVDLDPLSNLQSLGGDLEIFNNSQLQDISALGNLTTIDGNVKISMCNSLETLFGLHDVETISGNLLISFCNGLLNLNALNSLATIGGKLDIYYNNGLLNLQGLQTLNSIGGRLYIKDNPAMTNLFGLDFLTSVDDYIDISNNAQLNTLSHLSNLQSINGILRINNCDDLTTLSGLDNIDYNTITDVQVSGSSSLSHCAVQSICDYIENGGMTATFSSNADGCNSWFQVSNECQTLPIEWISFDLEEQFPGIELNWNTASTQNTDQFVIERSQNGSVFKRIGMLDPQAYTSDPMNYHFYDEKPAPGLNYYRIQQVDLDGSTSYSIVRRMLVPESFFHVYPNPTSGIIDLFNHEQGNIQVLKITDAAGRIIPPTTLAHNHRIDLSGQPDGLYFITLYANCQTKVERIIKSQSTN